MNVFKFNVGDKVKTVTNRVGEVKTCKHEIDSRGGNVTKSIKYYVSFNAYDFKWIDEHDLKEYHEFEFTNKFEAGFLSLLIDTYLAERNFDLVKQYAQLKNQYEVK